MCETSLISSSLLRSITFKTYRSLRKLQQSSLLTTKIDLKDVCEPFRFIKSQWNQYQSSNNYLIKNSQNQADQIFENETNLEIFTVKLQKHVKEYSNKIRQELKGQGKLAGNTSIWEIRNIFERQILWRLKWSVNNKSFNKLIRLYLIGYKPYVDSVIKSIFDQYKLESQNQIKNKYKEENLLILPEFSYKKICKKIKEVRQSLKENRKLKNKQKDVQSIIKDEKKQSQFDNIQQYYSQIFQALFNPYKDPYWQNALYQQQDRFRQTAISEKFRGITFVPSVYVCKILQRTFNNYPQFSQYNTKYQYLMGLKYNGKSHAQIMARHLASYLCDYKVLAISDLQRDTLNLTINSLCGTITRDLWYNLTDKMMLNLNKIRIENNNTKKYVKSQEILSQTLFNDDMKQLSNNISQQLQKNKNYQKSNSYDIQCQSKIKQIYRSNEAQVDHLYRLISIIKEIKPNVVLIDQFNYFSRIMYKLLQNQNISSVQITQSAFKLFLARIFIFLPYPVMRMFASINNYPYFQLMQVLFQSTISNNKHQKNPCILTEYFQGKQKLKSVFTFLQIFQTKVQNNSKIKQLINSSFFIKLVEQNIKIALSQRHCSLLAEKIYKNLYNNKNQNYQKILEDFKFQDQECQIQNTYEELKANLIEKVIIPSLQSIKTQIFDNLSSQICKFIQERKIYQDTQKVDQLYRILSNFKHQSDIQASFRQIQDILQFKTFYLVMKSDSQCHQGYKQLMEDFFKSSRKKNIQKALYPFNKIQLEGYIQFDIRKRMQSIQKFWSDQNRRHIVKSLVKNANQNIGLQFEDWIFDQFLRMGKNKTKKKISFEYYDYINGIKSKPIIYSFKKIQIQQDFQFRQKSFQKLIIEDQTLYVKRAKQNTSGVDYFLLFKFDKKYYFIALQSGKDKINNSGLRQFNNFEKNNQNLIKILKKTYNYEFIHLIVNLEEHSQQKIFSTLSKAKKELFLSSSFYYSSGLKFCQPDAGLKALVKFNNYLIKKQYKKIYSHNRIAQEQEEQAQEEGDDQQLKEK